MLELEGFDIPVATIRSQYLEATEQICESLELFAKEVMPEFKGREADRSRQKELELAPYCEAALARKQHMPQLVDEDIPVFPALGRAIVEEDKDAASIMDKDTHG